MANPWQRGRLTVGRRPQVMFGRMYEDPAAELSVFPAGGRVLAIASAGDTAAALARAGHRVTAVDISATQLAYAQARLAGAPAATGTAERLQAVARRAAGAVQPGLAPRRDDHVPAARRPRRAARTLAAGTWTDPGWRR